MSERMSDERQIFIPESFINLFRASRHGRLNAARGHIEERYEWCEDLAQMLLEPSKETFWAQSLDELTVLERTLFGLRSSESTLNDAECLWVVRRLCELLEWPPEACPGNPSIEKNSGDQPG